MPGSADTTAPAGMGLSLRMLAYGALVDEKAETVAVAVAEQTLKACGVDHIPCGCVHLLAGDACLCRGDARQLRFKHGMVDLVHLLGHIAQRDRCGSYRSSSHGTGSRSPW